ncbi:MAG: M23 family metallopeptidase [Ruminococcaceae bacterium]|nr:M23 family metallopeptidase [Oscillospiraceae bacterium]
MDNNNKKSSGLLALIVIAAIIITVVIIAIVTTNNDKNDDVKETDAIEDPADSDLGDAVSNVKEDISDIGDDISEDLFGDSKDDRDTIRDETNDMATDDISDTMVTEPSEIIPETTDTGNIMTDDPNVIASVPTEFCLPVTGYLSKDFSIDLPVFSVTMNDYRSHCGIDITAELGTNVAAFADGTVTDKYNDPFMGSCLEVTHSGGMVSRYMNLSEDFPSGIEVGSEVKCGQNIAMVGESASVEAADDSHLHFEVMLDDAHVDPMDYIEVDLSVDTEYEE